ncbi:sugar phosphate nucleotidyltransferase [Bradyrhizobium sp. AUGA SZCCT0283]|uniref:sugar phosphate nucleotidyltransferase n=1 Tax=Bradyrhizobium sp. AUGA SZCCT0283 TaxID=2807671 RepID=UPI001BADDAC7|nr:sugar phosphate nucleotidyltransferase [Bradyrhizobium sp. AUGA SZCCT0283]MBR1274271.1 NTP transferase domain-containing protein [Bradyrhizobium sp. AUGA SZCCT0283]
MRAVIGLLPAAGLGTRLARHWPKELVSLSRTRSEPICTLALRAMKCAGAERVVVVIAPQKQLIRDVLGNGAKFDLSLEYVIQPEPLGLPNVIASARDHLGDDNVVFALPDTIFLPSDALRIVHAARLRSGADVMLGVFPTSQPTHLAPVRMRGSVVTSILDKPTKTALRNTWGIIAWGAEFTRYCYQYDRKARVTREGNLSSVMDAALQNGLKIVARRFSQGAFCDAGTPDGLRAARSLWSAHHSDLTNRRRTC